MRATRSGIEALACFARRLENNLIAVKAGLTLEWSNRVTEGHIHRPKLVMSQGYGLLASPSYGSVSYKRPKPREQRTTSGEAPRKSWRGLSPTRGLEHDD